ncbi:CRISPR-associated endonuclease Cas2, partial [Zooshikella ganghwensis]|uniref:CRISPR-associated endonuclease Cas2 n=1 Tax=Zooshikella ganghwensis TaxID=202772 RepID=UPI001B7FA254
MSYLSGYQLMWMLVMFDLPVSTKEQRREATKFRNRLLDLGFEMVQFSVYMRLCSCKAQTEVYTRQVGQELPAGGKIEILYFTDKQYESIVSFEHGSVAGRKK